MVRRAAVTSRETAPDGAGTTRTVEVMVTYGQPGDLAARAAELAELTRRCEAPTAVTSTPVGAYRTTAGTALVFSAPHEMAHLRDGSTKQPESGTGQLALQLAAATGGSAIVTCGTQHGDPNNDLDHPYRHAAADLADGGTLIDLHMMAPRGPHICLGLGPDPQMGRPVWEVLLDELVDADLRVALNWPFGAKGSTVTSHLQARGVPATQVEIAYDCFDETHDAHVAVMSALLRAARRLNP
jgi:hypothetical protein